MLGKASRAALLTLAVAAPALVQANNFNYNSFEVRLGANLVLWALSLQPFLRKTPIL